MNTIPPRQLLEQLSWRYATKQFDPSRKINSGDWAALEEALRLTPSSGGLQPWKFIVVTDPAVRAKLLPASYSQPQITDASHLVVFAAKKNFSEADVDAFIAHTAETRGVSLESLAPFRNMLVGGIVQSQDEEARDAWARNQTYIALGNLPPAPPCSASTSARWRASTARTTTGSKPQPSRFALFAISEPQRFAGDPAGHHEAQGG